LQMTLQVVLVGSNGMLVGSDRKCVYRSQEPNRAAFFQFEEGSKFVPGRDGDMFQVGAGYLQSYLNEYAFRYNRRKVMRPMFSLLAERTTIQVCPSAREQRLLALPE
jgi:hypothetical protein